MNVMTKRSGLTGQKLLHLPLDRGDSGKVDRSIGAGMPVRGLLDPIAQRQGGDIARVDVIKGTSKNRNKG